MVCDQRDRTLERGREVEQAVERDGAPRAAEGDRRERARRQPARPRRTSPAAVVPDTRGVLDRRDATGGSRAGPVSPCGSVPGFASPDTTLPAASATASWSSGSPWRARCPRRAARARRRRRRTGRRAGAARARAREQLARAREQRHLQRIACSPWPMKPDLTGTPRRLPVTELLHRVVMVPMSRPVRAIPRPEVRGPILLQTMFMVPGVRFDRSE